MKYYSLNSFIKAANVVEQLVSLTVGNLNFSEFILYFSCSYILPIPIQYIVLLTNKKKAFFEDEKYYVLNFNCLYSKEKSEIITPYF